MLGAEINILDGEGNLDADEELMRRLDIRIAGIHSLCYTHGTKEENTYGMVQAIRHPYIQIISHPGDGTALLDFEPIVLASKECGTLLEINNSSLKPTRNKVDARDNNREILRLCKQYEVPVILGSDAHISFDIANYEYLYSLLHETEFPEELIVNRCVELFKKCLKEI
jgi:putative hydrolase